MYKTSTNVKNKCIKSITLVNTISGAKKQNAFFLANLIVLILKMTLVFHG